MCDQESCNLRSHAVVGRIDIRITQQPYDPNSDDMHKFRKKRLQKEAKTSDTKPVDGFEGKTTVNFRSKSRSKASSKAGPLNRKCTNASSNMEAELDTANSRLDYNFSKDSDSKDYEQKRDKLLNQEREKSWDELARSRASETEVRAQAVVLKIREHERIDPDLFGNMAAEAVPKEGARDMGGKFLVNLPSINRSKIYDIARHMPKGCHQHLHFNSAIDPEELFPHARASEMQDTFFIRSTRPLLKDSDYNETEIVFNVLPKDTPRANIFSEEYNPDWKDKSNSPWMLWADFRKVFPDSIKSKDYVEQNLKLDKAELWAREKMVILLDNAYGKDVTHNHAWACFNQGTRAFKGLLGYEGIYRWYIGRSIDRMIEDKVMYAELRPMLLDKTIPSNDGTRLLDHSEQMKIIVEEVTKKQDELREQGRLDEFPFGLKIIYCTPRSIPREKMKAELQDCLKLKIKFPDLICGFDLVGAEDRPNCINFYVDLLLAFTKTCSSLGISIPFMFHAGETLLDTGGSHEPENSNLYDSLLLNAKRIGHGYALLKHPVLTQKYKEKKICLELCPISNELLRLCGNVREHPFPQLLAAGLHCTLNADNPSLFRSLLSYEFYQVMVGDPRMTVHGWKQLAQWSLEHSCLNDEERQRAQEIYSRDWETFCQWVVDKYGDFADSLMELA